MFKISILAVDSLRQKTLRLNIILLLLSGTSQILFSQTFSSGIRFNIETVAYSWHKSKTLAIVGEDPNFKITSRPGNNYSVSSEFGIKTFFIPFSFSLGLNLRNTYVKMAKTNVYSSSDFFTSVSNKIVSKYEAEYQYAGINFLLHNMLRKKSNYWFHSKICYGLSYNVLVHQRVIENSHIERLTIRKAPFDLADSTDTDITTTGAATEALGYKTQKGFWTIPVSIYFEFRVYKGLFLNLQSGISLLPYDRYYSRHFKRHLGGPGFSFGLSYTFGK
jgi:hypothetical protein